jgi:hypothetical protein
VARRVVLEESRAASSEDVVTPTLTGLGERSHLARPDTGLDVHVNDMLEN